MTLGQGTFWQGKRVLLTGHTGFKGSWLALWLHRLGAEVTGISLPPISTPNLFSLARIETLCDSRFCDIRDAEQLAAEIRQARPEIVLHLAAQALVRSSYDEPLNTFASNVMGTAHLLEGLRQIDCVRVAVIITTDKVYRNKEWCWPYREEDELGGHDPYSASKAASEIIINCYRDSFLAEQGVAVASCRAGNVIGGGDWSADRLIPDIVRAWQSHITLDIRRPQAIRPWQHVLEPLSSYLTLAETLWHKPELASAYNFGPDTSSAATVRHVVELARRVMGDLAVRYGDGTQGPHEAGWLALEIAKARTLLGIEPRWGLEESLSRTMNWYRAQSTGSDAQQLCATEISEFEAIS